MQLLINYILNEDAYNQKDLSKVNTHNCYKENYQYLVIYSLSQMKIFNNLNDAIHFVNTKYNIDFHYNTKKQLGVYYIKRNVPIIIKRIVNL